MGEFRIEGVQQGESDAANTTVSRPQTRTKSAPEQFGENGEERIWATQSRLGRVVNELPTGMDRHWYDREPDIPRVAVGVKDRVNRLKALGNAVVPSQIYPILRNIAEIENESTEA